MSLTLAVTAVVFAACMHQISGMGFALVAMPTMILIHGPQVGLRLGLVLGLLVCVLALAIAWRQLEWRRTLWLAVPALSTVPVGAWLSARLTPSETFIGLGLLLAGLLTTSLLIKPSPQPHALAPALATGAAAGFVHVLSGLSAPVLTSYAVRERWDQRRFVASAQLVFIVLNVASLAARGLDPGTLSDLVFLVPALVGGLVLGTFLSRRLTPPTARKLSVIVSLSAAAVSVLKGLLLLS